MAFDAGGEGDVAAGTGSVDRTHAEFVVLLGMREYAEYLRRIVFDVRKIGITDIMKTQIESSSVAEIMQILGVR